MPTSRRAAAAALRIEAALERPFKILDHLPRGVPLGTAPQSAPGTPTGHGRTNTFKDTDTQGPAELQSWRTIKKPGENGLP
eukprot:5853024-Prymnesium_polylepis.1